MEVEIIDRIQSSLDEKRRNVTEFLETASKDEQEICLCDEVEEVQEHLHVIDSSLEKIEEGTLGVCTICHEFIEANQLEMDYTASICLDHYSVEDRRRLESELQLSQRVQRALLPQQLPSIPGLELAAFSRPSEIIGGDYFDFFRFKDETHGIVIADVSGHGVSAGMLMSGLQTALRTMAPETNSLVEIIERINRFYIHNINITTFVTIFLARFDPDTHELEYVNAGHNPPDLVRAADGEISWLMPTAAAVGLMEHYHPETRSVTLSRGDVLLLYTDGLSEAANSTGEQFGDERLGALIQANVSLPANEMVQLARQTMNDFTQNLPLQDDVTIVALKVTD